MTIGSIHLVPENNCPVCGKKLSATMAIDGNSYPSEGDITFCAICFTILQFGPGLTIRIMTDDEVSKLPKEVIESLAAGIMTFMVLKGIK